MISILATQKFQRFCKNQNRFLPTPKPTPRTKMSDQDYSSDFSDSDSHGSSSQSSASVAYNPPSLPQTFHQTDIPLMQKSDSGPADVDAGLLQQKQNQIARLEAMLARQTDEHIAAEGRIRHEAEQRAKKAAKVRQQVRLQHFVRFDPRLTTPPPTPRSLLFTRTPHSSPPSLSYRFKLASTPAAGDVTSRSRTRCWVGRRTARCWRGVSVFRVPSRSPSPSPCDP